MRFCEFNSSTNFISHRYILLHQRDDAVHGLKPLEENSGTDNQLLPYLELLTKNLDEPSENDDLLVFILGEALEVGVELPHQVHLFQQPLSAVKLYQKFTAIYFRRFQSISEKLLADLRKWCPRG